jgi:hypothetical protein
MECDGVLAVRGKEEGIVKDPNLVTWQSFSRVSFFHKLFKTGVVSSTLS